MRKKMFMIFIMLGLVSFLVFGSITGNEVPGPDPDPDPNGNGRLSARAKHMPHEIYVKLGACQFLT